MRTLSLASGWRLRERRRDRDLHADLADVHGWIPAVVPGTVHQDLMAAGRIPDPFWGMDEQRAQWVGERDWLYQCGFHSPELRLGEVVELCLDGLDTVATVWLNGAQLLDADDMFIPYRVPVTGLLRRHMNVLVLEFRSPIAAARAREERDGRYPVWNGDPARVHLRKAQYHFGWDWGPTMLTLGPWRDIRLELHRGRISDLDCRVDLRDDHASAGVDVGIEVERWAPGMTLVVELDDPSGTRLAAAAVAVPDPGASERAVAGTRSTIDRPLLWWPRGIGEQPLYRVTATLMRDGAPTHTVEHRFGIRSVRLIQEPLPGEQGTSFVFEINGRPTFCGGANWIPADVFLPRIDDDHYRRWVRLAADARVTMLRVWGGGIYEADAFYDACDELGVLVWQDFMFACGIYPRGEAFLATVQAEAEAAVRRLRHHPSIVLWCGNNEDYLLAAHTGRYPATDADPTAGDPFPGRAIYEGVLPAVCAALDPGRPYWPGSPYGGHEPNDPTTGDRHAWEVWNEGLAPYQDYPRFEGRFVSEFGMLAAPHPDTVASFAPPSERSPGSAVLRWHDKATDGAERLATYLARTFPDAQDLETWIHVTQLLQAEALTTALLAWRRRWGVPGERWVGGALVWQLDDCWPALSWALVDHAQRPKGAYHAVRRALAPVALGMAGLPAGTELWAMNATDDAIRATLEVDGWAADGTNVGEQRRELALAPNATTELGSMPMPSERLLATCARLVVGGSVAARASSWPASFRDVALPDPAISLTRLPDDRVEVSCLRPAKGVALDAGDGVRWSDGLIDLFPGDPQRIDAHGLGTRPVALRWLMGRG